jgi:hypothetical protein
MNNKMFKSIKLLSEQRPTVYAGREKGHEQNKNNQPVNTQKKSTTTPTVKTDPEPKKPSEKTSDPSETTPGIRVASGVSTDINPKLRSDLTTAASELGLNLLISSTSAGKHKADSRHYRQPSAAVDIAMINGYKYNSDKFKQLGDKLTDKLVNMGYTRNVEGRDNQRSVLWYMGKGATASDRHEDHLHVSNITGTTSKTDSTTKYYYKSAGDNNWSSFFNKTTNGSDLTITPNKTPLTTYLNSYTSKNIETEYELNTKVYKYYSYLKQVLQTNPEKYFGQFSSWYNDEEDDAAEAFSKISMVLYNSLKIANITEYHIASMNMATIYMHVVPHIKNLIETGEQGTVKFMFINITEKSPLKTTYKELEIKWDYM